MFSKHPSSYGECCLCSLQSKLVVTLKQNQIQQQQSATTIATGDFSSHYVSPKHQPVDGHVIQAMMSDVAPGNSPPSTRKANSAASTPNRSPTHRRYRMVNTETKLELPGHHHSDTGESRKGHDHVSWLP